MSDQKEEEKEEIKIKTKEKEEIKIETKEKEYNLHAIDMTREDLQKIKEELMDQLGSIGFLLLFNIPGYDEAQYLKACKAFHSLPPKTKQTLYLSKDNPKNKNKYRGYQPFKPNDPSHKEFYDQGLSLSLIDSFERGFPLYEETPFPEEEEFQWIKEEFQKTFRIWHQIGLKVLGLLAEGLGKPFNFFDCWFEEGALSTFRTIHYQPRSAKLVDSSSLSGDDFKLTTPEHTDSGFLTFLATFGYPGLQVEIDGKYTSVSSPPGSLVVNIGQALSRLSNYQLKGTLHRVLDIGRERYSSPLFLEPKYSARIPQGLLKTERKTAEEDTTENDVMFGDWLVRRFMEHYIEWKDFEVPPERKKFVDAVRLSDI